MRSSAIFVIIFLVLGASDATAQEDAGEVMADLSANNLSAEEIRFVSRVPRMRVISLGDFAGADLQRLEEVLRDTEDGFAEVQTAIEANEAFEARLREENVDLYSVVAVTRNEQEEFTVYTDVPSR
jgi:hypothetical protein